MKVIFMFCALLTAASFPCCKGSGRRADPQEVVWTNQNMRMVNHITRVGVLLNDSIDVELLFDTGSRVGTILNENVFTEYLGYTDYDPAKSNYWLEAPNIKVGNTHLNQKLVYSAPGPQPYENGILCPNYKTDTRTWEVNYEKGLIAIYDSCPVPEGAHVIPLRRNKRNDQLLITFPMTFICGEHVLETEYNYWFDTGCIPGFVISEPPSELVDFTANIPNVEFIQFSPRQTKDSPKPLERHFTIDQVIIPGLDTLYDIRARISQSARYIIGAPQKGEEHIVGMLGARILENFNLLIDLKNNRLVLTRHNRKFTSDSPAGSAIGMYLTVFPDGSRRVVRLEIGGPAQNAGIELGDRVLNLNQFSEEEISQPLYDSIRMLPPAIPVAVKIDRDGEIMDFSFLTYNSNK